jgi:hypothetical protein
VRGGGEGAPGASEVQVEAQRKRCLPAMYMLLTANGSVMSAFRYIMSFCRLLVVVSIEDRLHHFASAFARACFFAPQDIQLPRGVKADLWWFDDSLHDRRVHGDLRPSERLSAMAPRPASALLRR